MLRSDFSGGVEYLRSAPLFAFPAGPGAGPETASPREPPCREPQRKYIVKERGTLCAQMTEGRVAAPLSHYFSAPVLEQE